MVENRYPLFIASAPATQQYGVSSGETNTGGPTKKIWTDAEKRMVADTYDTRERACEIDVLAQFIIDLQKALLLGSYIIDDDNPDEKVEIMNWIDKINLLETFRRMFEDVRKHGVAYVQKQRENPKVKQSNELNPVKHLQLLLNLQRFADPFDETNFYYYQKVLVSRNWQNPEELGTTEVRVWYIPHDKIGAHPNDREVDLADIIEITNNEARRASLSLCLNEIFIKNQLKMGFPVLVRLVTMPGERIYIDLIVEDKNGNNIITQVPQDPDVRLMDADPDEYARQKTAYDTFCRNMQDLANHITEQRESGGVAIMTSNVHEELIESRQSFDPAMLEQIFHILNTQIAWALGFSLSLIESRGVELATSRTILETITPYLRGLQNQFQLAATALIKEQFPDAEFMFTFQEVNPRDEKYLAEIEELKMKSIKILKEIGGSDTDIREMAQRLNLADLLELGGFGLMTSERLHDITTEINTND